MRGQEPPDQVLACWPGDPHRGGPNWAAADLVFLEPRALASGLDPEVQETLLGYEKPRPFLVSVLRLVGPDSSVSPSALAHFEDVATRPPDLGPTPSKRIRFNLDAKEEGYVKMAPPAVKGLPKDDQGVPVEGQAGKHILRRWDTLVDNLGGISKEAGATSGRISPLAGDMKTELKQLSIQLSFLASQVGLDSHLDFSPNLWDSAHLEPPPEWHRPSLP